MLRVCVWLQIAVNDGLRAIVAQIRTANGARLREERGQTTAEYALVILAAAAIARDASSAGPATVTVTYDAPIAVPMVRWLFPSVVRLSARVTMRQEGGGP